MKARAMTKSTKACVTWAQVYHEAEAELALQDRIQAETADRKNELEAYVYSLRSKLADQLSAYAPAAARETLTARLNDMEVRRQSPVHVAEEYTPFEMYPACVGCPALIPTNTARRPEALLCCCYCRHAENWLDMTWL